MSRLATRIETVAGKRVRVARLGEGEPLLCLHGYPCNLQIFCELAPLLAKGREVIALDWPGLGESEPWPGGASPFDQAERLRALLDAWGIERASLLGIDMGAQPALVFAAKFPDRIRSLVVSNALVLWDEATSWEIRVMRRFGWNRLVLRHLPGIVFRRAEKTFLTHAQRLTPELREDLWSTFRRPEVREFVIRMCAGYQGTLPLLPELYGKIACPTLVLWGEADAHFPVAHARRLHELVPGSGLEVLPGAGHWMIWDRASEVAARVSAFLK